MNKSCPEGKIINPKTGKCVKVDGKIGQTLLANLPKPTKALVSHNQESMFTISEPMILASKAHLMYFLFEPNKKADYPIINLKSGNYRVALMTDDFQVISRENVSQSTINKHLETLKLHNPITEPHQLLPYREYGGVLQAVMWEHSISDKIQQQIVLNNSAMILMKPNDYQSLHYKSAINPMKVFNNLDNSKYHIEQSLMIWKTFHSSNCMVINEEIIISYDPYSSLYDENLLVQNLNGSYTKPTDYDLKIKKRDIIREILNDGDYESIINDLEQNDFFVTDMLIKMANDLLNELDISDLNKFKEKNT